VITASPLLETNFPTLQLHGRGKVRDIYRVGDHLLLVATDRISAFDYVLGSGIPDKGKVLTQLSAFWFERMGDLVPHHVVETDADAFPAELRPYAATLRGRSMLCRRTRPLPIECVARGYLSGSGWKEYQQTGTVCGVTLPAGLQESDRLPEPIFTPATKAESGHDVNISEEEAATIVGRPLVDRVKALTLEIFRRGCAHAESRGIIIADTKFEFGLDEAGTLVLMDEVLTPDSSRYWPVEGYQAALAAGANPPSYDKQFVRDWLEATKINGKPWDKTPPAPRLPAEVIEKTAAKYREALERLTG
jgi:phosphoribosylaminoimidazole-succinocarboxamide synthase